MIKKFVAWLKGLFSANKIEIEDAKVEAYIESQKPVENSTTINVKVTKPYDRPANAPLQEDEALVAVIGNTAKVVRLESEIVKEKPVQKSLDEKLKEVELPKYAQGRTLPPAAKRKFIKQGRPITSGSSYKSSGTSGLTSRYGDSDIAVPVAAMAATAVMIDDTPSRSIAACSSYSSSYGSDSSSSYDSSSYDSGSSCSSD